MSIRIKSSVVLIPNPKDQYALHGYLAVRILSLLYLYWLPFVCFVNGDFFVQ